MGNSKSEFMHITQFSIVYIAEGQFLHLSLSLSLAITSRTQYAVTITYFDRPEIVIVLQDITLPVSWSI